MTRTHDIPHDQFEEILVDLLDEEPDFASILAIPGVYEAVSEHYNNDVIAKWEARQQEKPDECRACDGHGYKFVGPKLTRDYRITACAVCQRFDEDEDACEAYVEKEVLPAFAEIKALKAKARTGPREQRNDFRRQANEVHAAMDKKMDVARNTQNYLRRKRESKPEFMISEDGKQYTDLGSQLSTGIDFKCPGCGGDYKRILSILAGGVHCKCGRVTQ